MEERDNVRGFEPREYAKVLVLKNAVAFQNQPKLNVSPPLIGSEAEWGQGGFNKGICAVGTRGAFHKVTSQKNIPFGNDIISLPQSNLNILSSI